MMRRSRHAPKPPSIGVLHDVEFVLTPVGTGQITIREARHEVVFDGGDPDAPHRVPVEHAPTTWLAHAHLEDRNDHFSTAVEATRWDGRGLLVAPDGVMAPIATSRHALSEALAAVTPAYRPPVHDRLAHPEPGAAEPVSPELTRAVRQLIRSLNVQLKSKGKPTIELHPRVPARATLLGLANRIRLPITR